MGRGAEESEELGNSGDAAGVWLLIARPRGILPRENRGFEEFLSSGFPEMELGILRVMLRAARSSRGKGSRCCGLKVPGARALTAALGQVAIAYSVAENILNCLGSWFVLLALAQSTLSVQCFRSACAQVNCELGFKLHCAPSQKEFFSCRSLLLGLDLRFVPLQQFHP